ncbi:MAG: hypothetical protein LQ351_001418 [Letrouitia transgressa]|nr:MAG: hypothetical protein LQ351_001418 [Letrouitia transgressa]
MAPASRKENISARQTARIATPNIRPRIGSPSNHIARTRTFPSPITPDLPSSMARLAVRDDVSAANVAAQADDSVANPTRLRFDDEQTHISTSSTKPASLDGKSTASGTAFTLDEKESLRPDDSASAKAIEEEDFYPGPGTGAQSSRVGSEAGSRAFRDQFNEVSENMGHVVHRPNLAGQEIPGIEEENPHAAGSSIAPSAPAARSAIDGRATTSSPVNEPTFSVVYQAPDEKLFEALGSLKDRSYVLGLEQEIINFIRESKTGPILDLPPCNSFYRLLAHKLADYYGLEHLVDNAVSAVRLYRTPSCRVPTPLSVLSPTPPSNGVTSLAQPAVQIMRRTGVVRDGSNLESGATTAASSMSPSKEGSETGDEAQRAPSVASPADFSVAREKTTLTREEREAKYKETRERIFKGFDDGENNEASNNHEEAPGMSRTSSSSGKKRSRKNKIIDDGFQARSQFNAYYPNMQFSNAVFDQTTAPPSFFNPYAPQHNIGMGQPGAVAPPMYQQGFNQSFQNLQHTQGYPVGTHLFPTMNVPSMNGLNGSQSQQYNPQMSAQFYQQPHPPALGQQTPTISPPGASTGIQLSRPHSQMSDQPWQSNGYNSPYQQQSRIPQQMCVPVTQDRNTMTGMPTIPYQYGQLPFQSSVPGTKNAHPLPGSYNRQAFNPKIRSFVPGTINGGPYTSPLNQKTDDSTGNGQSPNLPNGNHNTPPSQRNGSGQARLMPQFGSFTPVQDSRSQVPRKTNTNPGSQQGPTPSSLAKWATPASLPPKPPPPEVPSVPEGQNSLPQHVPSHNSIQVISNGQPMPIFQNGVYSMPSPSKR